MARLRPLGLLLLLAAYACSCPCEDLAERYQASCGITLRDAECTEERERCAACILRELAADCSNFGTICLAECG